MRGLIAAVVGILIAAGLVLVLAGGSTGGKAVALTLFGIACVLAVSLVFLAIGRAEDAEREASGPPPPADPHAGEAARRSRPRPPRRPS